MASRSEGQQINEPDGVIIRPLREDLSAHQLAGDIYKLMKSIGLVPQDIHMILVNRDKHYAKVVTFEVNRENFAMKRLSYYRDVEKWYDLNQILPKPNLLIVTRLRPVPSEMKKLDNATKDIVASHRTDRFQAILYPNDEEKQTARSRTEDGKRLDAGPVPDAQLTNKDSQPVGPDKANVAAEETSQATARTDGSTVTHTIAIHAADNTSDKRAEERTSLPPRHEATSTTDFKDFIKSQQEKPVDRTTSTPDHLSYSCPETIFYRKNQHIGSESRYTEFKKGRFMYIAETLIDNVGGYVCGFLNAEGGTLFLGVDDTGIVLGLNINMNYQRRVLSRINTSVSRISPRVKPSEYSVNFARVMEGRDDFYRNLKVVEICVKPRKPPEKPYKYCGNVYTRRDASLRYTFPQPTNSRQD